MASRKRGRATNFFKTKNRNAGEPSKGRNYLIGDRQQTAVGHRIADAQVGKSTQIKKRGRNSG